MPCRTKNSSTCLHLLMHIFMLHGVDPLVEEAVNRELWENSALGFCLQGLTHQFGGFLEELSRPYHCLQVGMALGERGQFGDSVICRSRRLYLISDLETSLKGL
jgi:hypothetical protein